MNLKLKELQIQGFKSFGKEQNIRFGDITIFIGANGSGKSNLISFFEMLSYMMDKGLAQYVAINGEVNAFMHLGDLEKRIRVYLGFKDESSNISSYSFVLVPTTNNYFIFYKEEISEGELPSSAFQKHLLDNSNKESGLPDLAIWRNENGTTVVEVFRILKKYSFFQFQNTSSVSLIRQSAYVNNTGYLMSNGGNLAAFLYGLQQRPEFRKYYDRIVRNIKLAYPSFGDFLLSPNAFYPDNIRLDWKDESSPPNFRFSPQQLSDGTLRFMALTALLLQPPETIPKVIVIDEPELGLHPSAISLLANMIYTAAPYSQIVLATQSAELLDYFEPEHIRVVEREGSNSIVTEPDEEGIKSWLEEYSLGQIWEKNIIGGRP